jgi:hypothetical protein
MDAFDIFEEKRGDLIINWIYSMHGGCRSDH